MYSTETRSQFIDLRARGWSYNKIARHTAISKRTLLNWGHEYVDDIAHLKSDYLTATSTLALDSATPEGAAQESYFHNLDGYPAEPATSRRSSAKADRLSTFQRKFRRFVRKLVRAAMRLAIFSH